MSFDFEYVFSLSARLSLTHTHTHTDRSGRGKRVCVCVKEVVGSEKERATICSRKSHPVTFGRGGGIGEQSGRMRCAASFPPVCLKRPTNAQQSPIKSKMTTHGARGPCATTSHSPLFLFFFFSSFSLRASCCCCTWWWPIEVRRQGLPGTRTPTFSPSSSSSSSSSSRELCRLAHSSSLYTHTQPLLVNGH